MKLTDRLKKSADSMNRNLVPLWLFADKDIYAMERTKLFTKSWIFVGHTSEFQRWDYLQRYVGDIPVILTNKDHVRGFLNLCPHRGAKILREDAGRGDIFRCQYHGWTFSHKGNFLGAPMQNTIYGEMDTSDFGLIPISCETYEGLIFCSIKPKKNLQEFLGDVKFYIDMIAKRSDGLEFSSPQRWIIRANWKTIVDNFIGDAWHFLTAHGWLREVGVGIQDLRLTSITGVIRLKGGHGVLFTGPSSDDFPDIPRPLFYPIWWPNLLEKAKNKLSREEFIVWTKYATYEMLGHIFPNLAIGNVAYSPSEKEPPVPILVFRVWRPISNTETEIWTWMAFDIDEPNQLKTKSRETFLRLFGAGGAVEHDDIVMWEGMTENSMKLSHMEIDLKYYGGARQSASSFEGLGDFFYGGNYEGNTISFLKEYINYLEDDTE
ncbi:aromatic ring-hydroxylating oxygenase subunit alpha [Sulfuracidifex metallicus]|uniref:Rieske 2Fe-2S domain-containing protein n=1 Tax=Sulfuracidifex metallicus DSM 6482 = JCM 9184 TaxID=523847 RepID=A0A6A9QJ70_SULME|nr:aromatic ring-hydroxylating dioxygenase subunit alpha [Sulfuracidifex metallicus]MUN29036.1 Rieske 2Fe-2S domain-containing protein [Sulfuracidifex metallicus DSM 6482 = JCM 9184]WOE50453.1 aromatic ring-hydroxylating dioxygenase subunit alpha [Sulfuracidifex metallicus DSM 6482 = JCM 9184]